MQMSSGSGFISFLDKRVYVREITEVDRSNAQGKCKRILCSRRNLKGEVSGKERTMVRFRSPTPSFPLLSQSGATYLRRMGEEVECGTWHIEMRSRRRISHRCRRRHEEGKYAGRRWSPIEIGMLWCYTGRKPSGEHTQKLHLAYRNTLIESLQDRHELGPLRPYQVLRDDG